MLKFFFFLLDRLSKTMCVSVVCVLFLDVYLVYICILYMCVCVCVAIQVWGNWKRTFCNNVFSLIFWHKRTRLRTNTIKRFSMFQGDDINSIEYINFSSMVCLILKTSSWPSYQISLCPFYISAVLYWMVYEVKWKRY